MKEMMDMTETFKSMKVVNKVQEDRIFNMKPRSRMRGHDLKLKEESSTLTLESIILPRKVDVWNRLPAKVVSQSTVK